MSIQINSSNSISYNINCTKKDNKATGKSFNDVVNTKLDDEDQLLYEQLKNAGVDLTNHTLEWQKQHIKTLGFPPLSAPSVVRKAWREILEKMPSQQREQFQRNIVGLMGTMKHNNKGLELEMNNPNFSYANYAGELLNMVSNIKNMADFNYSLVNDSLICFIGKLNSNENK